MDRWIAMITAAMTGCSAVPTRPSAVMPDQETQPEQEQSEPIVFVLEEAERVRDARVFAEPTEGSPSANLTIEAERIAWEAACAARSSGQPCEVAQMKAPSVAALRAKFEGWPDEVYVGYSPILVSDRVPGFIGGSPPIDRVGQVLLRLDVWLATRGCGPVHLLWVDPRTGLLIPTPPPAIETESCSGRPLPAGFRRAVPGGLPPSAARWMELAADEDEAVEAFSLHLDELALLGAPQALIARAARALEDEQRHRDIAITQASRLAGRPLTLGTRQSLPMPRTSPQAILLSVARDGAVNETLSFVELMAWSESLPMGTERALVETIAADEARHAALAWDTLRWAWPNLDDTDRAQLLDVLHEAPPWIGASFLPFLEGGFAPVEAAGIRHSIRKG